MKTAARHEAQQSWMEGISPVIAATTAFGMGIDKSDVRLVLHYDVPEDPESWYQESGRGGRDGLPASALCLFNAADIRNLKCSSQIQFPGLAYLRQVYQAVVEYLQIPISAQPERYYPFEITDFCKKFDLKTRMATPALRLLSREGFWTLTESVFQSSKAHFRCERQQIDQLPHRHPFLGSLAVALLRLYSGIFQYPVSIHIPSIAQKLHCNRKDVELGLLQLANIGLLDYEPAAEGPQLFFNSYRVDSQDLIINTDRINSLRTGHEKRTQAIIRFLEDDKTCRSKQILNYFGEETAENCGHCDVCRRADKGVASHKSIRETIIGQLKANELPVPMSTLTLQLSEANKAATINTLRQLVEQGLIQWHPDNSFSLPPSKARRS